MPKPIILYAGTEDEVRLPAVNEVCPRCHGDGTCDAWDGGMTASEMDEQGPEFLDDYLAGMYSVPCRECNGDRVVAVLDEARCTPEQLEVWMEHVDAERELRAMERAERLFGC